jgi:hypothetical protein
LLLAQAWPGPLQVLWPHWPLIGQRPFGQQVTPPQQGRLAAQASPAAEQVPAQLGAQMPFVSGQQTRLPQH